MGDKNSKPEYPFRTEQNTESHDAVGEGKGRYQTHLNYCNTNAELHSNEDLIRALIKENRIKSEEIKAERIRKETEIRTRLDEQKCNEIIIREGESQLKNQAKVVKKQNVLLKKEGEMTKQAIEREKMVKKNSVDGRNPKFQETDRVKETCIKKQNEHMENRKCIEKQLLGNLVNTEMSKLKCTVKRNSKPLSQQLNDDSQCKKDVETVPDMYALKIEDERNTKEQRSGRFKKNKNKRRNFDLKKKNAEHYIRSNAKSNGTKYSRSQSQEQVHMNPNSNQNIAMINNKIQLKQYQTTLEAVTQNHNQPPPAYLSHSFDILNPTNSLDPSPSAVNYPQQLPVYDIPPPSYSLAPQIYRKKNK